MINRELLDPRSIVVIGGSNNVHKPGGAIVRNIIQGGYQGILRIVNPKEDEVQGIKVFHDARELPPTELAVLVIPAKLCPDTVELLARDKGTKAFIIISAGFGEETHAGALMEQRILDTCKQYGSSLIGPNCIGLLNRQHHSVFTQPIPKLSPQGVDFVSGSGATAVFILESAVIKGLQFNSVWSIGNGKQIGIEDVLQYMDETFDAQHDSRVKLLYIENIANPDKLLFHASSLIRKGCRIAAIKAGSSESGSRAASSHTGAIASSDSAVEALFRKAGIVRCHSREELTTVGCIMTLPPLTGKRFAIVTHAGGPGVMLTDALSKGGLEVPKLEGEAAEELKGKLFPGSSVANPIDILATGTAEQLGTVIEYCEHQFDNIDAIAVIYGTPGLTTLYEAYEVLHQKIQECRKPIFPILPSLHTAGPEVAEFLAKGHVNFSDEVTLATALSHIMSTPAPAPPEVQLYGIDIPRLNKTIMGIKENGYLPPDTVREILSCAGIPIVPEMVSSSKDEPDSLCPASGIPRSSQGRWSRTQERCGRRDAEHPHPRTSCLGVRPDDADTGCHGCDGTEDAARHRTVHRCQIRTALRPRGALWSGRHLRRGTERRPVWPGSPVLRRGLLHDSLVARLQNHQGHTRTERTQRAEVCRNHCPSVNPLALCHRD